MRPIYGEIMANPFLDAALSYESMGFSVIPIRPGQKKPIIQWADYQNKKATPEEINEWWEKYPKANVGIVTGEISDLFVVDIDTEEGQQNLMQYGFETIHAPTVKTPRGGQHLYFRYPKESNITIGAGVIPGTDYRGNGGFVVAPPSKNGTGNPYEWVIGLESGITCALPSAYIKELNNKNSLYRDITKTLQEEHNNSLQTLHFLTSGTRDNDLFHVANCLLKGGCKKDIASRVLEILAKNATPPFPEAEAMEKIESAIKRSERRDRNLKSEIYEWTILQEGYWNITEALQALQIITKEEKNNARVIINRLKSDGIIEKYGEKAGQYRTISKTQIEPMKFITGAVQEFPVMLPLGLDKMCRLYPKNIVIVAGSKSSGKTALMMNIAFMNQHNMPVVYFNSEMGDEEYTDRMKLMGVTNPDQIKMQTYPLHKNYHDYITGDRKLYLVDFLEIHDNFYEIAKPIRQIHDNLKDGICVIAIQMKMGAKMGRGAEFSMEKSRLYLSMDYEPESKSTMVKIVDAKSPRPTFQETGLRDMFRYVKIIGGSRLSPLGDWRR